jgi:RNA polymerase sigma-70 factor (ECF subfamily)
LLAENTDHTLVMRLQKDDLKAFDALYQKYHQAIYANILKITKDADITQDILQEVFIALWQNRSVIDANQSLPGWLFVISYNKSITYLKKLLKQSVISIELDHEMHPDDESVINIKETQFQLLEKAIDQLSPQKRKVFELCKLQGKSYEEAAKELNISKHTVKEYLSSALATIKDYVHQHKGYMLGFILFSEIYS